MQPLWTWSGKYFGYRDGDSLWTYAGKHVGYFSGDNVFALDGKYMGEVVNDRLTVNLGKKATPRSYSSSRYSQRIGMVKYTDYVGFIGMCGHTDFPPPATF